MRLALICLIIVGLTLPTFAGGRNNRETKNALKKLQGNWKAVKAIQRGKTLPKVDSDVKLIISEDTFTLVLDGREMPVNVRIQPRNNPKQIDFLRLRGGTYARGIYKMEGNRITLCWNNEGGRPNRFQSPKNSRTFLAIFEREKKK